MLELRDLKKTYGGRTVLGGGGIVPDVVVTTADSGRASRALQSALGGKAAQFRRSVASYAASIKGSIASADFAITPHMRDALYRRLAADSIIVDRRTYDAAAPLVDRLLGAEIARSAFGARAAFERGLESDLMVRKARALLTGVTSPAALIGRAAETASR